MPIAIARFPPVPAERDQVFRDWFVWSNDQLDSIVGLKTRRVLRGPDGSYTALVEHESADKSAAMHTAGSVAKIHDRQCSHRLDCLAVGQDRGPHTVIARSRRTPRGPRRHGPACGVSRESRRFSARPRGIVHRSRRSAPPTPVAERPGHVARWSASARPHGRSGRGRTSLNAAAAQGRPRGSMPRGSEGPDRESRRAA